MISGIFGFLTLEKIFSEENEGDGTKEKVKESEKVRSAMARLVKLC